MNDKIHKIGIIGSTLSGKAVTGIVNDTVIIVKQDDYSDKFTITVNGEKYEPTPKFKQKLKHNKNINNALISAGDNVFLPYFIDFINEYGYRKYERKLPDNINVIKEYGLILLKQSSLSRWERDEVVFIFEKSFNKIPVEK